MPLISQLLPQLGWHYDCMRYSRAHVLLSKMCIAVFQMVWDQLISFHYIYRALVSYIVMYLHGHLK